MALKKGEIRSIPMQLQFLDKIKSLTSPQNNPAEELADLLDISSDSVYRRFRGDTNLTLEDILRLCEHYKVDFDFKSYSTNLVLFRYNYLFNQVGFEKYLKDLQKQITTLQDLKYKEIIFLAIDVPMFHHFKHPMLAAFKVFFWLKNVVKDNNFNNQKFRKDIIDPKILRTGKQIYEAYCNIPSTEIWTTNTANSLISQIDFSWSSGMFESKEVALQVCKEALDEIKLIEKQSGSGTKQTLNKKIDNVEYNYSLYLSDMEVGNNCIYVKRAESKEVYLGFQIFNNITTIDQTFCNETTKWIDNLMTKSILISGVGEKQRYVFFNSLIENIEKLINKISLS